MDDYISRATLMDRIRGTGYADQIKSNLLAMAAILPAADVKPVARGKWIDIGDSDLVQKCSVCGDLSCCRSNFCGNCGADMRKEAAP